MCNKMIKTSNGNFHKGFYESCKENYMKQLLNIRSNNQDMELKTYYSAEFFLHGICHIFAYDLHRKFGYDILELKNKSGGMTHWCCVSDYKGKKLYIDDRGATTDYNEFLAEFQPNMGNHPLEKIIDEKDLIDINDDFEDEEQLKFADDIIERYYNYYSVH